MPHHWIGRRESHGKKLWPETFKQPARGIKLHVGCSRAQDHKLPIRNRMSELEKFMVSLFNPEVEVIMQVATFRSQILRQVATFRVDIAFSKSALGFALLAAYASMPQDFALRSTQSNIQITMQVATFDIVRV